MEWGTSTRQRSRAQRKTGQYALRALLVALALAPLPAAARTREVAMSRGEILPILTVLGEQDIDFGQILAGTANGTVVMNPGAAATCTGNNGIVHSGNCHAAKFEGSLPFLFNLQVTKPAGDQITLTGPAGATMRLHDFTFAKGTGLMLGGSATDPTYFVIGGNFIVYVGGTLDVARTQRPGIYNGTFTLIFNYD